ncbi:MAG: WD40 repeat domain-containing protein [Candidatus Helarchaeota archaeon]
MSDIENPLKIVESIDLEGHKSRIYCLDFSPDGKSIASAGLGNEILIWNLSNYELEQKIEDDCSIYSINYSPDGKNIVTDSSNKIKIWNIETGELIREIDPNGMKISSPRYSPDGKFIVTGGEDALIKIWKLPKGKLLKKIKGHESGISSVDFSPDGKLLASGSKDHTLRIWEFPSGKQIISFKGKDYVSRLFDDKKVPPSYRKKWQIFSIRFSSDGNFIAAGALDATVRVFNLKTLKCIVNHSGHFGLDGYRWGKKQTEKEVPLSKGYHGPVDAVDFSQDGLTIASCGQDGTLQLWDIKTSELMYIFFYKSILHDVKFSPNGMYLAVGGRDKILHLKKILYELKKKEEKEIKDITKEILDDLEINKKSEKVFSLDDLIKD